jgi:hypothetical protein
VSKTVTLNHPPPWFVLDAMKKSSRKWDRVAPDGRYRSRRSPGDPPARNADFAFRASIARDAAWDALEDLMTTRH